MACIMAESCQEASALAVSTRKHPEEATGVAIVLFGTGSLHCYPIIG